MSRCLAVLETGSERKDGAKNTMVKAAQVLCFLTIADTVVFLTGCDHARDQSTPKTGTKRLRNLRVTNGVETADVALWGKHAYNFDADNLMDSRSEEHVILLLCGITSKKYYDSLSLHTTAACRWYVNPDIPEVCTLRTSDYQNTSASHADKGTRFSLLKTLTNQCQESYSCIMPLQTYRFHCPNFMNSLSRSDLL